MKHSVTFGYITEWFDFSDLVSYTAGQIVMYDNKLYKFIRNHSGAWSNADVTEDIGQRNTWSDWELIPVRQPVFSAPPLKSKIIDIPGADSVIDLTDAVTGYPVYGNREGTLSFLSPKFYTDWIPLYAEISEYLHGRSMKVVLEDDPGFYYEGRFVVNESACDEKHDIIAIDYNVGPYKWAIRKTDEPWLWNPFSFIDGVIYNGTYTNQYGHVFVGADVFGNIEIGTTAKKLEFEELATGRAPIQPTFASSAAVSLVVKINNETVVTKPLSANVSETIPGLVIWYGRWLYNGQEATVSAVAASGTAILSVVFRAGRL